MKIAFDDQVAIVTGAGGGIGRAVSLALGRAGAKVLAVDLDAVSGAETVRQVQALGAHVAAQLGVFVVVQSGAAHMFVVHRKSQRLNQMQTAPGVRGQANDVAGVGRNFGLDQNNVEHRLIVARRSRRPVSVTRLGTGKDQGGDMGSPGPAQAAGGGA